MQESKYKSDDEFRQLKTFLSLTNFRFCTVYCVNKKITIAFSIDLLVFIFWRFNFSVENVAIVIKNN